MVSDPLDVEATLEALWGSPSLPPRAGVLHVLATWRGDGEPRVIRITPQSPKSDTDFFLLNLARARADVILTTGRILRDEPTLAYSLPERWRDAMSAWRARAMQRTEPPTVAVLTSGRGLDPNHPALHGWARPLIVTSEPAARALRRTLPREVEVIGLASTQPRDVIAHFCANGATTVSVEAGPSSARALYADPVLVDELWHSEFLEPHLDPELRGQEAFLRPGPVAGLRPVADSGPRTEHSGRWRFLRLVRGEQPPHDLRAG